MRWRHKRELASGVEREEEGTAESGALEVEVEKEKKRRNRVRRASR